MQNSEKAAAVSTDMSRIFEGFERDAGSRAIQTQARPDLVVAVAGPLNGDRPRALLIRFVAPAIVMFSLLVCSALAFEHYRQGPSHRVSFRAPEPKAVTQPLGRASASDTVQGAVGDASLSDISSSPGSDAMGDPHERDIGTSVSGAGSADESEQHRFRNDRKVSKRGSQSDKNCRGSRHGGCGYAALRNADARLRAAYLEAMDAGVSTAFLREVHQQWRQASRHYKNRPQATVRRYEILRQQLIASRDY